MCPPAPRPASLLHRAVLLLVEEESSLPCPIRRNWSWRMNFLFLGFVSDVFCLLLGRRLAAIRNHRWCPLRRLVRRMPPQPASSRRLPNLLPKERWIPIQVATMMLVVVA